MKSKHFQFIIAFIFGISFFSFNFLFAKSERLSDLASDIHQTLIDRGSNKVGNLDLNQLVSSIKSEVKWAVINVFSIGAGSNNTVRTGSSCHIKEKSVYVNKPHLINLKDKFLIEQLLLHESLCVLGWVDTNYSLSSTLGVLYLLTREDSKVSIEQIKTLLNTTSFNIVFSQFLKHSFKEQFYELKKKESISSNPKDFKPSKTSNVKIEVQDNIFADGKPFDLASGGVTGVGGGGNGFGLFLKTLLFKKFIDFSMACSSQPDKSTINYPYFDNKKNSFNIEISCIETRLTSWWYYILNLQVESSYFNYTSEVVDYLPNFPWIGSFVIDESDPSKNTFFKNNITLIIDELSWMLLDKNDWASNSTGVFLSLIVNHFHPKNYHEDNSSVFVISGNETLAKTFFQNFNQIESFPCEAKELYESDFKSRFMRAVGVNEFIAKRLYKTNSELKSPPFCITWF